MAPRITPAPTRKAVAVPPVYRPASVQRSSAPARAMGRPPTLPPPFAHRPQPLVHAVQLSRMLQQKPAHAIQRHTPPLNHGAQRVVARPSVIQRWQCRECGYEIRYSYDHSTRCSQYYHRTYETAGDRDANRYDRRHGETRTRSGSFDRQYRSGEDERRHYHENLYSHGGYVETAKGYTDRHGVYHSY